MKIEFSVCFAEALIEAVAPKQPNSNSGPNELLPQNHSRHLSIQPQSSDCVWEPLGFISIDFVPLLASVLEYQKSLRELVRVLY